MSIYFEKARELGNMILESEQSIMLADATNEYKNNEECVKKMEDYKAYQENVRTSMQSGTLEKEEITMLTQRLTEMAIELKSDPVIAALVNAENEFNGFVNQVMNVVKATIMGQDNSGCGSEDGCSGCSGCNQ